MRDARTRPSATATATSGSASVPSRNQWTRNGGSCRSRPPSARCRRTRQKLALYARAIAYDASDRTGMSFASCRLRGMAAMRGPTFQARVEDDGLPGARRIDEPQRPLRPHDDECELKLGAAVRAQSEPCAGTCCVRPPVGSGYQRELAKRVRQSPRTRIREGYERFDHGRISPWASEDAAASLGDDVDAPQPDDRLAGRDERADAGKGLRLRARCGGRRAERKSCADQRRYEREGSERESRDERAKANAVAARWPPGRVTQGKAHDPTRRSIARPTVSGRTAVAAPEPRAAYGFDFGRQDHRCPCTTPQCRPARSCR